MRNQLVSYPISFLLTLTSLSCIVQEGELVKVNFDLDSSSETISEVDMKIYVDNKEVIKDTITSNYYEDYIYSHKFSKGEHTLKITALNDKVIHNEAFIIGKNDTLLGVFVSFAFYQPDSIDIKRFKEYYKKYYNIDTIPQGREKELLTRIVANGKVINDW